MEMDRAVCAACGHDIDAAARLCPYCGADPRRGKKAVDTQAILQEFHRRKMSAAQEVLEYARHRQGWVIAIGALVLVLILAGFHEIAVRRNATAVSSAPAVALTDVADLNNQPPETQTLPMPELQFQYDGNPRTMRTPIAEPGGVVPSPATAASAQTSTAPRSAH